MIEALNNGWLTFGIGLGALILFLAVVAPRKPRYRHEPPPGQVGLWATHCSNCGRMYREHFSWDQPVNDKGLIGFAWCGWCKTRHNFYIEDGTE